MEGDITLFCTASIELRDRLRAAAAELNVNPSEFMRRAVIHAIDARPAALASHSGMRASCRPARRESD
ncbi:hypothetical protein [Burkholderia diffusa]|uniref:hypothetical protein n=1 Tax=Burkholderia diffusa TaxID=488732 RepID=UPI002ABD41C5|nr:hypothetical protein [Burkholderia diffusa]